MQAVDRAAAHRCSHAHAAVVVREKQLLGAGAGQREALADFLGQMVVGENHFVAEDGLGSLPILSDHAATLVGVPQRVIQPHDGYQGRETQLARLEDQIAVPEAADKSALGAIGQKRLHKALAILVVALHDDLVQRARKQAPLRVSQAARQFFLVGWQPRSWRDGHAAFGALGGLVPALHKLRVQVAAWFHLDDCIVFVQAAGLLRAAPSPGRHRQRPGAVPACRRRCWCQCWRWLQAFLGRAAPG